jgi:hypothetical protein
LRRPYLAVLLVPLAVLALFALPVAAEEDVDPCRPLSGDPEADPGADPFVCETRYYLQCDTAVGGKANLVAPVVSGNAVFTDAEPTGSFTAGEGCGEPENSASSGVSQDNVHVFTFEGFADGNIDAIAVELHDFSFSPERFGEEIELDVRISVEGASPFGGETVTSTTGDTYQLPRRVSVPVTPELSDTGATVAYRFTITDIDGVLGTAGLPGAGDTDHHVKITIDSPLDGAHVFVWGADEIPAGITLNPLEAQGTVVPATG